MVCSRPGRPGRERRSPRVDSLRGQLRALIDIVGVTAEHRARLASARPRWRDLGLGARNALDVVRANLTRTSPAMRHAVRMAVTLAIAVALARGASFGRGYWVPITVLFVLKPDFGQTFTRGLQRYAGTTLGVVVATLLARIFTPGPCALALLVFAFAWTAFALYRGNYAAFSAAITAVIVFFVSFGGIAPGHAALDRFLDTLIGATLALAAYLLWPTWEQRRAGAAIAGLVDGDRRYLRAPDAVSSTSPPDLHHLRVLRYAARPRPHRRRGIARAGARRAEPGPRAERARLGHARGNLAHRFGRPGPRAHVRGGHDPSPPPELSALATAIDGALAAIAEAARAEAPLTSLPKLRPLHDDLSARVGEDDFVAAQLDRMVDAVDTMAFLLGAPHDELAGSPA